MALPMFEAEAKERMERGTNQHSSPKEKIPEASSGQARDKAAATVGVNPRYVSDAKKIKEQAPEIFEQVARGEKTSLTLLEKVALTGSTSLLNSR